MNSPFKLCVHKMQIISCLRMYAVCKQGKVESRGPLGPRDLLAGSFWGRLGLPLGLLLSSFSHFGN